MLLVTVYVSQSLIWERETTLCILSRKALTIGHNQSGGLGKLQAQSHQEITAGITKKWNYRKLQLQKFPPGN